MVNCKIELDLTWSKNCVISEISRTVEMAADPNANPSVHLADATQTKAATFKPNNTKPYVLVVICK